jgi:hypothetical protein
MISNDTKRRKVYERLHKFTADRVARALGIANEDVAHLSLSALINLLFLAYGDGGATGAFNPTFGAALELVGTDLMWLEAEAKKEAVPTEIVQ